MTGKNGKTRTSGQKKKRKKKRKDKYFPPFCLAWVPRPPPSLFSLFKGAHLVCQIIINQKKEKNKTKKKKKKKIMLSELPL